MSFDLVVWHTSKPITEQQARAAIDQLLKEPLPTKGEPANVTALYNELTAKWPEIDNVPPEHEGDFDYSPWSFAIQRLGPGLLMHCVFAKGHTVANHVLDLTRKHGLIFYDLQDTYIDIPESLTKSAAPPEPPKPWYKKFF